MLLDEEKVSILRKLMHYAIQHGKTIGDFNTVRSFQGFQDEVESHVYQVPDDEPGENRITKIKEIGECYGGE